jgi:hypothetical protein
VATAPARARGFIRILLEDNGGLERQLLPSLTELVVYNEAGRAVDVLVGTPSKLLEMACGNGWDKECGEGEETRRRKWVLGQPEVSLSDVERVMDVLFGAHTFPHVVLLAIF